MNAIEETSAVTREWERKCEADLRSDIAFESRLLAKEIAIVAIVVALVLLRVWLL